MAVKVWDGLVEGIAQTDSFTSATFIYLIAPLIPDWSQSGEFVEIDCQLLVQLGGLWRLADGVKSMLTTREVFVVPKELVYVPLKLVLLGDVNTPVELQVWVEQDSIVLGNVVDRVLRYEFNPTDGQVDFPLPNWSTINQADSTFYLNGVLQDDGVDYVWDTGKILWTGDFSLEDSDLVTIIVVVI